MLLNYNFRFSHLGDDKWVLLGTVIQVLLILYPYLCVLDDYSDTANDFTSGFFSFRILFAMEKHFSSITKSAVYQTVVQSQLLSLGKSHLLQFPKVTWSPLITPYSHWLCRKLAMKVPMTIRWLLQCCNSELFAKHLNCSHMTIGVLRQLQLWGPVIRPPSSASTGSWISGHSARTTCL